jgi:hypothetical protein
MRGSRKDGRRRAMASEGLYMAVIMAGGEFDRTVIVPTIKMRGRSSRVQCGAVLDAMRAKAEAATERAACKCGGRRRC